MVLCEISVEGQTTAPLWPVLLPILLGAAAVYLLLPRPRNWRPQWGAALAGIALVAAGGLLIRVEVATAETVLFCAFSGIAILSGGLLVTQINPVHAALSFALVVLSTCGLFLLQAAPFLMAATTIVYAGAIVVTFLFVIMLAQQAGVSDADHRSREPLLSSIAGFVLLGALLYILNRSYDTKALDSLLARATAGAGAATVEGLSASLGDEQQFFTDFQQAAGGASGPENRSMLEGKVREIRVRWAQWKRENNVSAMRQALGDLMAAGTQVRNNQGALRPLEETEKALTPYNRTAALDRPGETVAPLGRMLFTDYLIPVELAGTLLLVATIGAIAITGRRPEGLR